MRKATLKIFLVLGICCTFSPAEDMTFPPGSLIIPMDSQTQDTANEGIFQAYGLILHLLASDVVVHLSVNEDKPSNDYPDFDLGETPVQVVNAEALIPVDPLPTTYAGGPYIIDASSADTVLAQIQLLTPDYDSVVVHQVLEPITVPIRETYQVKPRTIALLNNSDQEGHSLLACYLRLADVPQAYYQVYEPDEIIGGAVTVGSHYILWLPHWLQSEETGVDTPGLFREIKGFINHGGNVLATCKSIDTMELTDPIQSTHSIGINGNVTPERVYLNLDLPFSQIGDYPFVPDPTLDTQSYRNYVVGDTPATGHSTSPSNWQPNLSPIVTDATPDDPWVFYGLRRLDSDPNKGNVHYIAGHRYVSCEPIISPGVMYRIDTTMKRCDRNGPAFWQNSGESLTITLQYDGGLGELEIGPLFEGTFDDWENEDFLAYTAEDRTNYGPGCRGEGEPSGTDHFDGLLIQNKTTNNYRITNVIMEWDCGESCREDYKLSEFNIQVDNGECGTSSCDFCTNVYPDYSPRNCDDDASVGFTPISQKGGGTDVIFQGGDASGDPGSLTPRPINIGGIRYILNTLLNGVVDPVNIAEYSRSGAVIYDDVAYFGTFEWPNHAGHFRAFPLVDSNGNTVTELVEKWDTADFGGMPAWSDRKLFTFINGTKLYIDISPSTVQAIEAYIDDPNDDLESVEADIKNFLGLYKTKRLGGIEHSTPAIIPPNKRSNPNRPALAYVGTTSGVLEQIDLETGSEYGGYVPAAMLKRFNNIGLNDPNRPKVDASPTVLDAYLLDNPADPSGGRTWKTVMLTGHGNGPDGLSCIDITYPDNVKLFWEKFDSTTIGNVKRASVSRYKATVNGQQVMKYVVVVPSNLPNGNGLMVQAFDLQTGDPIWDAPFVQNYSNLVNDIPAPVAIWDKNQDGFGDRIMVGDLNGRLWQVDLATGHAIPAPGSTDATFPLVNMGVSRPIAASPSVGRYKGKNIVAFGTGGADWAVALDNVVIVYDLDKGQLALPPIQIGDLKLYSPVSIASDQLIFVAVRGTLNSADPTLDLAPDDGQDHAYIFSVPLNPDDQSQATRQVTNKGSGSPYVKDGHTVEVTNSGKLKLYGEKTEQNFTELLRQLIWRDLIYAR